MPGRGWDCWRRAGYTQTGEQSGRVHTTSNNMYPRTSTLSGMVRYWPATWMCPARVKIFHLWYRKTLHHIQQREWRGSIGGDCMRHSDVSVFVPRLCRSAATVTSWSDEDAQNVYLSVALLLAEWWWDNVMWTIQADMCRASPPSSKARHEEALAHFPTWYPIVYRKLLSMPEDHVRCSKSWREAIQGAFQSKLYRGRSTHDKILSCGGDGTMHFFNQTDRKPERITFLDMGMFCLAVEALEPIAFLVDVVILFQDDILISTRCHLPVDIGVWYRELNFLRSIFQNWE